jgi:hypothetical protein
LSEKAPAGEPDHRGENDMSIAPYGEWVPEVKEIVEAFCHGAW